MLGGGWRRHHSSSAAILSQARLELKCREEPDSLLSRPPTLFVRKFGSESPLSEDRWQAPERSCLEKV